MSDFSATATAEGKAITNTNFTVTATSSASANSNVSYEDALNTATNLAVNYANETAKYDTNLINQATDISTYLIDYNTKQINSAPDLIFYYSNLKKYSDVYQTNLGDCIIKQNTITNLYSDIELTNKIGIRICEKTIYTNPSYVEPNYSSCLNYYKLPKGQLFFTSGLINVVIQNIEGTYVSQNQTFLRQIASGSGYYLNKTGIFEGIINNETSIRTLKLYLN